MRSHADGYFEAFVNKKALRLTSDDKAVMARISETTRRVVPGSQVRWAGSQIKGTAIEGSDLDVCVESRDPVTEAQRRELSAALRAVLGRSSRILSHAIRLPLQGRLPKVDIAFANAAFGSRPLPDTVDFHEHPSRKIAARGLKIWTRSGNLPWVSGWAVEALVLHLDHAPGTLSGFELFGRLLLWLVEKATSSAVEGVLRPAAYPRWDEAWSVRLPGRLEALKNSARALQKKQPVPESWRSAADVERWLCR